MRWTLDEIVTAVSGRVEPGGAVEPVGGLGRAGGATVITGISTDTRTTRPAELFVALRAERDGHDFVAKAVEAGAGAVLVDSAWAGPRPRPEVPTIVVGDTAAALLRVGAAARQRIAGPVVGITGSVGKTSTKDLAAAALSAGMTVVASEKSFNNEIGVPLTLANSPEPVGAAVIEMGARGPGHITTLCDVARPTIGVVTAVAAAHIEMFGGLDGVAKAKGELVDYLPSGGVAVLNGDDPRVRGMASRSRAAVVLYGVGAAASASGEGAGPDGPSGDVVAERIELDAELRPSFRAVTPWGAVEVRLEARGVHQVGNALAALAVAGAAGVDIEAAAAALTGAALSPWRMEVRRTAGGALLINDSYNANPASVGAALRSLAAVAARRRVAVLGVMAELGDSSAEEHRAVAGLAAELGIEIIAVGDADYGIVPVAAADVPAALGSLGPDTAVLVKGSRVAGLEAVAEVLLGR